MSEIHNIHIQKLETTESVVWSTSFKTARAVQQLWRIKNFRVKKVLYWFGRIKGIILLEEDSSEKCHLIEVKVNNGPFSKLLTPKCQ